MKRLMALFIALALAVSCRASLGQVTSLTTGAVATILIAAPSTHTVIIQNLGANAVNITIDGGSTFTSPYNQKAGTDPTTGATGKGLVIPPISNGVPGSVTIGTQGTSAPIRAIMQTGTTTLNIITDGYGDTFPTA